MAAEFGILIQSANLSKYSSVQLSVQDIWGVIMPSKYELAQRQNISKAYLIRLLLICSQRVLVKTSFRNEFQG